MGGKSKSTSTTKQETDTITLTDNAGGDVEASTAQATAIRLSNIAPDADVNLEIQNHGLAGEEIAELLAPAGDALETISRDYARTSSATAALSTTVGETFDDVKDVVDRTIKTIGDTVEKPETWFTALAISYFYFNRKKKRKS